MLPTAGLSSAGPAQGFAGGVGPAQLFTPGTSWNPAAQLQQGMAALDQTDVQRQALLLAKQATEFMGHEEREARRKARKMAKESTSLIQRGQSDWIPMVLNIIMQPLLFNLIYFVFSFYHRDRYKAYLPYAVQFLVVLVTLAVFVVGLWRGNRGVWFFYTCAGLFVAQGLGTYYGNANYEIIHYYYTFRGMAQYVNINPSLDSGKSRGDAGQVYFKEGSRVDVSRAVAFKNTDLFCVAPIVLEVLDEGGNPVESEAPKSMDWWAVGLNCCNPSGEGFSCGDAKSPLARSGMRLLDGFDLQYYKYAVHQFAAKYKIPAENPLFFHWVEDPVGKVHWYYLLAHRQYYAACFTYFGLCLLITGLLRIGLNMSATAG